MANVAKIAKVRRIFLAGSSPGAGPILRVLK